MLQRSQKGYMLKWRQDSQQRSSFSAIGVIGELETPLEQLVLSQLPQRNHAPITSEGDKSVLRLFYTEPPASVFIGRSNIKGANIFITGLNESSMTGLMDQLVKETDFRPTMFPDGIYVGALETAAATQERAYDLCRETYPTLERQEGGPIGERLHEMLFLHTLYFSFLTRYNGFSRQEARAEASRRFKVFSARKE